VITQINAEPGTSLPFSSEAILESAFENIRHISKSHHWLCWIMPFVQVSEGPSRVILEGIEAPKNLPFLPSYKINFQSSLRIHAQILYANI
jgi:hypothetical protein